MKDKLEVGMYVRTDKGFISQIADFKEHYTKGKRLINSYSTKEVVENYLLLKGNQCKFIDSIDYSIPPCYPSDEELEKIKSHIVKSSHNIIDLIEKGDYVNGYKVSFKDNDYKPFVQCDYPVQEGTTNHYRFYEEAIYSIVTKEQFSSMEYRLGDDK